MFWFWLVSFSPMTALLGGALSGGWGAVLALFSVTGFVALIDRFTHIALPALEDRETQARRLGTVLGLAHLVLLPLLIALMVHAPWLDGLDVALLLMASGLYYGQVGNSNAHELIHARSRLPRRVGVAVYTALLFGHHASAHPLVHHVHVATPLDPNSARAGEGFWRFFPRAWVGSWRAGLAAENARRARHAAGLHPYLIYSGGGIAALVVAFLIGGRLAVLLWVLLAFYAQMQLMLSDYVQHYGLQRAKLPNGRYEPVSDRHSWNAAPWFSSAMMLNAPRHSDHHAHPNRPFPALRLSRDMPVLPRSLPMMAALAMMPRLWRRVMDKRVAALGA